MLNSTLPPAQYYTDYNSSYWPYNGNDTFYNNSYWASNGNDSAYNESYWGYPYMPPHSCFEDIPSCLLGIFWTPDSKNYLNKCKK
jgi:hypothetical protein